MTPKEIITHYFQLKGDWGYAALIQEYYEFFDRGEYFPKENRDADYILKHRGKDMLGLTDEEINEIIKNGCSKPFVGKMVKLELWR